MRRAAIAVVPAAALAGLGLQRAPDVTSRGFAAPPIAPVVAENALPGTSQWNYARATEPAIEGYAQPSVAPGDDLTLHVSTRPAANYRIEIYRLGWYGGSGGRLIACIPSCTASEPGAAQQIPTPDPVTGEIVAGWPVTDQITVGADWTSGYYVAQLVLTDARPPVAATVPFIVREPPTQRSAILVVAPVDTWQAYNGWGGKSLYPYNSTDGVEAKIVSFDRPYAPASGPYSILEHEVPLVHFLEREGYDVSYATDVDIDADPAELLRHRLVIVAGHSEYWSGAMRTAFDTARDEGTNLMFFGADDAYWQIRYEDNRQTIVEYKGEGDPVTDPALQTTLFRELTPARAECSLIGVEYQNGEEPGNVDRSYSVTDAGAQDPWLAGTNLSAGDVLAGVVGYEWDAVRPGCTPANAVVLFHYDDPVTPADAVRYTAPSGARIFAAGTLQLGWALDDCACHYGHTVPVNAGLQQFMRNVLADLTKPAAPALVVRARPSGTSISFKTHDPRVTQTVVRHPGAGDFALGGAGVSRVCVTAASSCVDRPRGHRTYTYAAVAIDSWGESVPAYSAPVAVPDSPPVIRLVLARRTSLAFTLAVRASDRDADPLTFHWSVNGHPLASHARAIRVAATTAPVTVRVVVTDGHGGSAAALCRPMATRACR